MTRPAVGIVTGFTKSREALARGFESLRSLRRRNILQRLLYLTWDSAELDAYVEPAAAMEEVEFVRIPEPKVSGSGPRRGVAYQIHNLKAALARVSLDDALIVKLRPDFIADEAFLESKITAFDDLCAPSDFGERFGSAMPASPFAARIWIPWGDANMPLHCEDAAFIGLKQDVAKLADDRALRALDSPLLSNRRYGWAVHAARFAAAFASDYPIFENYLRNFRFLPNDRNYRLATMPAIVREPFFWQIVAANAWICATSFHLDCGAQGQLTFYCNNDNRDADWSSLRKLKVHPPYNAVEQWRQAQAPGGMFPTVGRVYARLVDDSWPRALFTQPDLRDITPGQLRGVLDDVRAYEPGGAHEKSFFRTLEACWKAHEGVLAAATPA